MKTKKQRIVQFLKRLKPLNWLSHFCLVELYQENKLKFEDIIYPMLEHSWVCYLDENAHLEYYKNKKGINL